MTLSRSNTWRFSMQTLRKMKDEINISIMSANSKVGKSMLTDLLCQTNFMNRTTMFRKEAFTFVNDPSIIIRKISAKKVRNNNLDAQQWLTISDILIIVIREDPIPSDYQMASLRHLSKKNFLFIVRTHINETISNDQISENEEEILLLSKNIIWSRFGEFLTDKNRIYLIGHRSDHTDKWDFSRFKEDLIEQCSKIRLGQIKDSIVNAPDLTESVNLTDEEMLNKEKQSLIEYINENGLNQIDRYFSFRLRRWEQCALNIAVTGLSGAGKSSFINAIRGVTRDSQDFAPTSSIECTTKPRAYHHPLHRNLAFWDLPGCYTAAFPRETYLQTMDFENYDVVIIIYSGRFMESDSWLAKEMIRMRKPFFFLRSKIDLDMDNEKRDCRPPFNETEVLNRMRTDCSDQLAKLIQNQKVYLVSGNRRYLHKWDMNDFMHDLREACPQLKRESLVFSMSMNCREAVQAKVQYLRERTWFSASATAVAAVLPFPGFSMSVNVMACLAEAKEYRQQLGLHNKAVERLAILKETSSEYIRQTINSILPILDEETFEKIFKQQLISISAALGHCVPIMGSVFSLRAVTETLNYFLTLMEKAALTLVDIHLFDMLPLTFITNSQTDATG